MTDGSDPRRSVFSKVSTRPACRPEDAEDTAEEADETGGLRRLAAPPPPKPATITVTDEPVVAPTPAISTPSPDPPPLHPERGPTKSSRHKSTTRPKSRREPGDAAETFGTQRGNLRYVQTSLSAGLAEALDARARDQRMVVGDVVMEAVEAFTSQAKTGGRPVRRPKGGNPVRKDIGLFPDEAAQVYRAATMAGYKPSAFLREAIERFFSQREAADV
jgi:hypothetical protein